MSQVTAIMPIYNQEEGALRVAMDSMFCQTLYSQGDLYLLFVLDGPNEETRRVFYDALPDQGSFLVVDKQENEGIAVSLNRAYALVTTPFVTWVSSDNDHDQRMMGNLLYQFMDIGRGEVKVVFAKARLLSRATDEPMVWNEPSHPHGAHWHQQFTLGHKVSLDTILRLGGCGACFMFRKEVIDAVKSRPQAECAEDLDFFIRVAKRWPDGFYSYPDELMTYYFGTAHSYTETSRGRIIQACGWTWSTEILPCIEELGYRIFYVRPEETERMEALAALPTFPEGGNTVVALIIPRGTAVEWGHRVVDYPVYFHLFIEEDTLDA